MEKQKSSSSFIMASQPINRTPEQIEQRVKDIDTAIAALKAQITTLENERSQLTSQSSPAAAMENTAKADAEALDLLGKFDPLPQQLADARSVDGTTTLANILEAAKTAAQALQQQQEQEQNPTTAEGTTKMDDETKAKKEKDVEAAKVLREEILSNVPSLSLDLYGCQLLAKFIETAPTAEQKSKDLSAVVDAISPHIKVVALINHGSRLLQRVAEAATPFPEIAQALVTSCIPQMVDLASEANGSHLLLRFVSNKYNIVDRTPLFKKVGEEAIELAKSRHGCGFLQRAIESCGDADLKKGIINPILESVLDLVRDPFGNYVIQFILDTKVEAHIETIVRSLLHHIATFACNKFGSNVIEKCMRLASSDVRQLLIDEITDPTVVHKLVTDEFANYVIQTAILSANDAQFLQIQSSIRPFLATLKTSPHGTKIESRMTKRVKDMQRAAAASRNSQQRAAAQAAGNNMILPGGINLMNNNNNNNGNNFQNNNNNNGGHRRHNNNNNNINGNNNNKNGWNNNNNNNGMMVNSGNNNNNGQMNFQNQNQQQQQFFNGNQNNNNGQMMFANNNNNNGNGNNFNYNNNNNGNQQPMFNGNNNNNQQQQSFQFVASSSSSNNNTNGNFNNNGQQQFRGGVNNNNNNNGSMMMNNNNNNMQQQQQQQPQFYNNNNNNGIPGGYGGNNNNNNNGQQPNNNGQQQQQSSAWGPLLFTPN